MISNSPKNINRKKKWARLWILNTEWCEMIYLFYFRSSFSKFGPCSIKLCLLCNLLPFQIFEPIQQNLPHSFSKFGPNSTMLYYVTFLLKISNQFNKIVNPSFSKFGPNLTMPCHLLTQKWNQIDKIVSLTFLKDWY